MLFDVRQAFRLIGRQPAFSAFAVVTLGIGIGAATAVFTLVHAVLLHSLPFADPDRLAWMYNARTERDRAPFSIPDLDDYLRDASTLEGLATFTNVTANLTGSGTAERLEGTRVSGNFFPLLGSPTERGRTLDPQDESSGSKVAVLTYGLWKRRFGGDPAIVGSLVVLNGVSHTVVGVMPSGFVFPFRDAEFALPLALRDDPRRTQRGENFLRVVARVKPGVSLASAKADLDTIARRLQRQFPDEDARKIGVNLYPLQAEIVSDYRQILWMLFAAVGVLLAIGCGNLANLLLVRAAGRKAEFGLRASLGASRAAIGRQLLVEAGVLALLGGALGVAVASGAVAAWRAFGPASFPRMASVTIDGRVLTFALITSVIAAIVSGVIPAWSLSRDPHAVLGGETRSATGTRRQGLARRAFVVFQVAGSAVLLVCMSLVARGFAKLEQVDPGFAREHALSVQLSLPPARYATSETIARFYDALSTRLTAMPGAQAVGAVSLLPLSGMLNTTDVYFPDRPPPTPDAVPQAHFRIASRGYFAAAGIRVMAGREFTDRDTPSGPPVALVSRTFAERHWPGSPALGKPLQIGTAGSAVIEVVGVVSDAKQFTLDAASTADLYMPLHQMPPSQATAMRARMNWVVRSLGDPRALDPALRTAVHDVDPDVAASSVRTLDEVVSASLAGRRVNVRLLEIFGQVAMVLSAIGVYAIAAFSANARRRELAIRSAFGASRAHLARLVFWGELRPALVGVIAGLLIALGVSRWLGALLFATSAWDPVSYAGVGLGLLVVATLASYLPARRAGIVDPAELLR